MGTTSKDSVGASGDLSDSFLDAKGDSSAPEAHPGSDGLGEARNGSEDAPATPPAVPQQPTPQTGAYPAIFVDGGK